MDSYTQFFQFLTGHKPLPYQARLAEEPWPDLLDIPTGLGKTAAIGGAWLWRRLRGDAETGRRLVYCLPMRVLVEQTREVFEEFVNKAREQFAAAGRAAPTVHVLMGGFLDEDWERNPEHPAILIGTQDMLLSRARTAPAPRREELRTVSLAADEPEGSLEPKRGGHR